MYAKHARSFPLSSRVLGMHLRIKAALRRATHEFEGDRLLSMRYERPSPQDRVAFVSARQAVSDFVAKVF